MWEGSTFRRIFEDHVYGKSMGQKAGLRRRGAVHTTLQEEGWQKGGVEVAGNNVKDENKKAHFTSSFFI